MSPDFHVIQLPQGGEAYVPKDIKLTFPKADKININEQHYLAYIPWQERFLEHIPPSYREFYCSILPQLANRTSDVHTALSVAQIPVLLDAYPKANERIVYLATILHDIGWSEVSKQGLVDSLNYSGVLPTENAKHAKRQHLIFGEALAYKLLDDFDFDFDLTEDDAYYITEIIRRHDNDQKWEQGKYGDITLETKLVCDADRLWSYTHENFWQDTVRKGVEPAAYLETIHTAVPTYFFTPIGRSRAHALLRSRRDEVSAYQRLKLQYTP
jgi:HD superfamily phosphohydrolase YqeK